MTWMKELENRAGIDLNYELWQRLEHFFQTIPKWHRKMPGFLENWPEPMDLT